MTSRERKEAHTHNNQVEYNSNTHLFFYIEVMMWWLCKSYSLFGKDTATLQQHDSSVLTSHFWRWLKDTNNTEKNEARQKMKEKNGVPNLRWMKWIVMQNFTKKWWDVEKFLSCYSSSGKFVKRETETPKNFPVRLKSETNSLYKNLFLYEILVLFLYLI